MKFVYLIYNTEISDVKVCGFKIICQNFWNKIMIKTIVFRGRTSYNHFICNYM